MLTKKRLLRCISGAMFSLSALSEAHAQCNWSQWEQFRQTFVSDDGRVIDHSTPMLHTVSEGQAYAMFFALAANDKDSFAKLLRWTANNLAGGDLTVRLPAWQWGRRADQSWGVIDPNAASDADLWIAYTLILAGEVWQQPAYNAAGQLLAQRILREESRELPGLGLSLLPAPMGFDLGEQRWKLNPSYVPLQLLRWLAVSTGDTRWQQMLNASRLLLLQTAPRGFSPDWVIYQTTPQQTASFNPDLQGAEKGMGGYNAIRVYLWAGMLHEQDTDRSRLLKLWQPMAELTGNLGFPPEYIDVHSGEPKGAGSTGFSAALLPFLKAGGHQQVLRQQMLRIQAQGIRPDAYYDQVLSLFGQGFLQQQFRFNPQGKAEFVWQRQCKREG